MNDLTKPEIAYSDFLKLPEADKAKYAEQFEALNETPVLAEQRLLARWQKVRYPRCIHCNGQGYHFNDNGNPDDYGHTECVECDGTGEASELPFDDFLDGLPDTDPDLIAAERV